MVGRGHVANVGARAYNGDLVKFVWLFCFVNTFRLFLSNYHPRSAGGIVFSSVCVFVVTSATENVTQSGAYPGICTGATSGAPRSGGNGEGSLSPSRPGSLGSVVSFPSGVRGTAPNKTDFGAFSA